MSITLRPHRTPVYTKPGRAVGTPLRNDPAPGFGELLADLRTSRRMSQARLADLADMDHTTLSRLESGSRSPRRETVNAIATALKLDSTDRSALQMTAGYLPDDRCAMIAHEPAIVELYALLDGDDLVPEVKAMIRRQVIALTDQVRALTTMHREGQV